MATVTTRQAQDVDDQAQALNGFRQFYEQLRRGRFHGQVWQLMMDDGFLLREPGKRSLRQHFSPPPEHVTPAVPLSVQPSSVFAGRPLERESPMVLCDQEEYDLVSTGELNVIGLSVHRDLLDTLAPSKSEWLDRAQANRSLNWPMSCALPAPATSRETTSRCSTNCPSRRSRRTASTAVSATAFDGRLTP